jgi:hypothetical protein
VTLINQEGRDKLAIALKHTRADIRPIIEALKNIVYYSQHLAKNTTYHQQFINKNKMAIKAINAKLEAGCNERSLHNERARLRQEIDKLRINRFLKSDSTPLSMRLQVLLSDINRANVVLVGNALNYHSEIAMAEFLIDGNYRLELSAGSPSYQYIGNSINICSKCKGILHGGHKVIGYNQVTALPVFFRGSYDVGYPNYMIPTRTIEINRSNRVEMMHRLDALGVHSGKITLSRMVLLQNCEVSDSD